MKRYVVSACLAVLTLLPTAVFAQSAFDPRDADFKPYVKIGYERLGVNFSLPGNWNYVGDPPPPYPGSLEIRLEDSYAWVGAIGVTAEFSRGLSVFLNGEGIAPKNVIVHRDPPDGGPSDRVRIFLPDLVARYRGRS